MAVIIALLIGFGLGYIIGNPERRHRVYTWLNKQEKPAKKHNRK